MATERTCALDPAVGANRWTRGSIVAFAAFTIAVFGSLAATVHPWYDPVSDSSVYILTARALAAGEGYRLLGEPFSVRPPGFSLLIAPLLAARGTDFHALNLLVSTLGAAGVCLLALYVRPRVGTALALGLAAAVWLNPGYQRLANRVLSDVPGLTMILACLLTDRWAQRGGARREVALALAVAATAYLRSLGVLLVPAVICARVIQRLREPRGDSWGRFAATRLLPIVAIPVLALLPWSLRNARVATDEPRDQTWLHSYSTAMWHADPGDPGSPRLTTADVLERVPQRSSDVAHVLGSGFASVLVDRPKERPIGARETTLTTLLLVGWLAGLLRHRGAGEFFVGGALLLVSVYFAFDDRIVLPIWVLVLGSTVELANFLLRRVLCDRATKAWVLALLAGATTLSLASPGWSEIEARHVESAAIAAAVAGHVPASERLAAPVGWHHSVYLGRPVWGFNFAARRTGDMTGAEALFRKYSIDRVLLVEGRPGDRRFAQYFSSHHAPGERAGAATLFRVGE